MPPAPSAALASFRPEASAEVLTALDPSSSRFLAACGARLPAVSVRLRSRSPGSPLPFSPSRSLARPPTLPRLLHLARRQTGEPSGSLVLATAALCGARVGVGERARMRGWDGMGGKVSEQCWLQD